MDNLHYLTEEDLVRIKDTMFFIVRTSDRAQEVLAALEVIDRLNYYKPQI